MRESVFAISLIVFAASGCGTGAPKFTPIPRCALISIVDVPPFLECAFFDGDKEVGDPWIVQLADIVKDKDGKPLKPEHPERYICTTDEGYASAENFKKAMRRWAAKNCK